MSRKGILVVAALFGIAFLLLALATRGYREVEALQSMEKAMAAVRSEFPAAKPVSTAELAAWMEEPEGVILLDAREAEEFSLSRVPGAQRVSSVEEVMESGAGGKRLVVYDSVGFRSAALVESIEARVSGKVFYLEGGVFQWANEGRTLLDDKGNQTREVHPYNKLWGRLLERSGK